MKKILAFLFIVLATTAFAQDDEYDNQEDVDALKNKKATSFTDWKSRTYFSVSSSFLIDYISSPLDFYNPQETQPAFIYDKAATQTSSRSLYTIGFEARYNLVDVKDNLALGLSVPAAFGFGQAFAPAQEVKGGTGFGNVQIPVLARIYFGAGSTFSAQEDFGINVGAGYEFNKLGVFDFNANTESNINNGWIMPAVTMGVSFVRGLSPIEVNLKYGFGPIQEQFIDGNGNRLTSRRTTRATSLKLNFVYPLN